MTSSADSKADAKQTLVEIPGLPYVFSDGRLLQKALTHRSLGKSNNERLEFLGDSVLNFVVTEQLYKLHPSATEGELSRLRARVVRGETLAEIATHIDLGDYLRLGSGELKSGGYRRASILADALEAVIGAIYLDSGFEVCSEMVRVLCEPVIKKLPDANQLKDPKTRLQEWLQSRGYVLPVYELISESGADHNKQFYVRCELQDDLGHYQADGSSRRKAEQAAAVKALAAIENDQ